MGIVCDTAASSREALDILVCDSKYDICFVDREMPMIDGVELSREVRRARVVNDPVIIMTSSYDWNSIENDARAAGVNGFLSKPLFPSDIVDCINNHVGAKIISDVDRTEADASESFLGYTVLLAEDVEINREIVQALLEPTQITIECAVNGLEAVRVFSASPERYDMIFMDLQMPEMDGLTATEHIRALEIEKAKEIPIIAMTANVFREDVERCLAVGMNDHIGKPIDYDNMINILKRYLRKFAGTGG